MRITQTTYIFIHKYDNQCHCYGRDNKSKRLYPSFFDAKKQKMICEEKNNVKLEIYKCPEGKGYHLTHK